MAECRRRGTGRRCGIDAARTEEFDASRCQSCGGLLTPDVVCFGENVPDARKVAELKVEGDAGTILTQVIAPS